MIIRYLFLLNRREPIAFYYNLLFPLVAYLLYLRFRTDPGQTIVDQREVFFQFCAFTIFTSSLYGVGLSFISWRESGFFLTFCRDKAASRRLLIGQLFLRSLFGVFFLVSLYGAAAFHFTEWDTSMFLRLVLAGFGLCLLVGWMSQSLMLLRLYPSDLSTILNALVFVFIMLNAFAIHGDADSPLLRAINFVNPLHLITVVFLVVEGTPIDDSLRWQIATQIPVCLLLGQIGLRGFHPHPAIHRV